MFQNTSKVQAQTKEQLLSWYLNIQLYNGPSTSDSSSCLAVLQLFTCLMKLEVVACQCLHSIMACPLVLAILASGLFASYRVTEIVLSTYCSNNSLDGAQLVNSNKWGAWQGYSYIDVNVFLEQSSSSMWSPGKSLIFTVNILLHHWIVIHTVQ